MHYTRFASICQNSFNFESFTHYHKWHNHAVYTVYTKSAKFFSNHRKTTYSSGFMHFFRKFLPNLFLPPLFRTESLWYFSYKEACFPLLFGIKTQQIVKGRKGRIVFHCQWINLRSTFSQSRFFRKFKKNRWTDNFSSKNFPPSLIFSSISASGFTRFPSRFPNSVDDAITPRVYPPSGLGTLDIRNGPSPPSSKTLSKRGFKSAIPFFHHLKIHLPIPYYNQYFSIIL